MRRKGDALWCICPYCKQAHSSRGIRKHIRTDHFNGRRRCIQTPYCPGPFPCTIRTCPYFFELEQHPLADVLAFIPTRSPQRKEDRSRAGRIQRAKDREEVARSFRYPEDYRGIYPSMKK